jgi:hypothetical protein
MKFINNQNQFNKGISAPIGILIVLVLAILVGGMSIWQWQEIKKEEVKMFEIKLPGKITKVEIADWKTYRNEEYGFELNYPKDWEVQIMKPPKEAGWNPYPIIKPLKQRLPEEIFISVTTRKKDPDEPFIFIPPTAKGEPEKNPPKEVIGNKLFYYGEGQFEGQWDILYETISKDKSKIGSLRMIIRGGRQSMMHYLTKQDIAPELEIFKLILSTFKFIK